ncbi:exopolysaccharide biosynthesis protein [Acuticoccus kandeliae]|uniref:exopolysaccharide biosynthesis protein n=1 Tax=Acuticoccus kandeliae TaxID=2073160 RepID=UPI001300BADA|nr:exopolysaccharide biosynthesis protein [Acuticoccus kandeliae]
MSEIRTSLSEDTSLGDVMDRLRQAGSGEKVTLNDILKTFQDRSLGVMITVLGLIAALPAIGAVPGMSMLVAVMILFVMANGIISSRPLRVPGRLGRVGVARDRFEDGLKRAKRFTSPVDRLLSRRLTFMTEGRIQRALLFAMTGVLALIMFPLELVPWGSTFPSIGIVSFGLAIIAKDGVFAIVGYIMMALTFGLVLAII